MWISPAVLLFLSSLFFLFSLPLASRFSPLSRSLLLLLAPLNRPTPSICSLSPGRVQRWNRAPAILRLPARLPLPVRRQRYTTASVYPSNTIAATFLPPFAQPLQRSIPLRFPRSGSFAPFPRTQAWNPAYLALVAPVVFHRSQLLRPRWSPAISETLNLPCSLIR